MLRIHALGGLSVSREGQPASGSGARRRPLALLSLLAVGARRGVSRDRILAYLWPEADEAHARGVLRQTVCALRRDLGHPDLLIGKTELSLNPEIVTSDIDEFATACDRGEHEVAIALYSGPFLDGFHLADAPEFEEWADRERQHLRRQALIALATAANRADKRGEHEVAVAWWWRATELDPLSSRVALGLMRALVSSGDNALALPHAKAHDALLRDEVGTARDPAVAAFADEIRASSGGERSISRAQPGKRGFSAPDRHALPVDEPLHLRSGLIPARHRPDVFRRA